MESNLDGESTDMLEPTSIGSGTRPRATSYGHSAQRRRDPAPPRDALGATVGSDTLARIPEFARRYFTSGNQVTPLFDAGHADGHSDEIFAQVREMISGAKQSIQIEMFSLEQKGLVDLLLKEKHDGVKVQVIMDPGQPGDAWSAVRQEAVKRLQAGGVQVLLYPVRRPGDGETRYQQLDHVKMLTVDGQRAIIGGMNWGNHSPENHDYDVKVAGPAVEKMEWLFREDWLKSGGQQRDLPYIEKVAPRPDGGAMVNLVVTGTDENEQTIGKTVHRAIDNARKSVHAELFVLTDRYSREALIRAHQRGVDVKVILNPLKIGDQGVNEEAFNELKAAGVPVKWYVPDARTKEKLHSKTAVFDDDQSLVGSANWSYAGFHNNREADVEVLSRGVSSRIAKIFDDDWKSRTDDTPTYLPDADQNAGG